MANGAHQPSCYICNFYASNSHRGKCTKYIFKMPAVGFEIICKDWQPNEAHRQPPYNYAKFPYSDDYLLMVPGVLYYYSYASSEAYQPFESFDKLQNLITEISIHNDKELGWVGYIWDNRYSYFPGSESTITLRLGTAEHVFKVCDVQRDSTLGDRPAGLRRIIYSRSSPNLLYDWFNKYFDIEAILSYRKQQQYSRSLLSLGLFVFIEVLQELSVYSLRPITLHYNSYKR